ncbi:MAG: hypothetical protein KIS78_21990 [Labilithrix sp.]|nr:hypothetical protein [Labilithrix sp.]MCW5835087.1 hypothetical protein [Labilithrix sp.]
MNRPSALLSVVLGLGASASACFWESSEPPQRTVVVEPTLPPAAATLRLRWSIDGRSDPNECIKAQAANAEVSVVDRFGREVGAWQQPCGYFTMDVPLTGGTYSGSAALLDSAGRPRTTRVTVDTFTLGERDVIDVQVDFPASSFL